MIDSGASNHISHQLYSFQNLKTLPHTNVTVPNGVLVNIVGLGDIHLGRDLILHDVLYIPQFKFNLLSVSCLTKQLHCRVCFDETSCGIQAPTQGLMIGMGRAIANLYFLDIESVSSPGATIYDYKSIIASVVSLDIWHKRLGHPSSSKLTSMQSFLPHSKTSNKNLDHCHICDLSKQKHLPFISKNNISPEPFDLIHIDTWGPFSTPTHDGFRYFLTIVDDSSRATWVYLMKTKSDALSIIPTFVTMVETQFNRKVKGVRSDNAP